MALFNNAVDRCTAELRKLRDARERLGSGLIDDQARLQQLRGQLADAELASVMDEESNGPPREEIAALEVRIAGRRAAQPKLLERIREAMKALAHARANVLRQQVTKKEEMLADYRRERAKRLEALQEFTGARWIVDESADEVLLSRGGLEIHMGPRRPLDRGVLMAHEIAELKNRADTMEAQAAARTKGEAVAATTLEELLTAAAENPLAPSRGAIEAWYAEANRLATDEWRQMYPDGLFRADFVRGGRLDRPGLAIGTATPADRITNYTLAWDEDGEIDRSRSGFTNRLAPLPAA